MKGTKTTIVAGLAVLAMSASPAFAGAAKHSKARRPASDQAFVIGAAGGSLAEIELGKLAQSKASSDQVKTFGKRMVDDHQKALDSLKTVATAEHITLPSTLTRKDQALKDRLEKLSGSAFDRAYMNAMVKDHRHDVAEFRAESTTAKAADVKQYASTTLPTLEGHLKLAQTTQKDVVGTSGKRTNKKPVG